MNEGQSGREEECLGSCERKEREKRDLLEGGCGIGNQVAEGGGMAEEALKSEMGEG